MSFSGGVFKSFQAGGMAFSNAANGNQSFDSEIKKAIDLPAGKSGSLTTRTDDDTGVVTVASGHGITGSDTVDVYWAGGRRYGVDVTGTTATTISINIGSGDNLPAQDTAVVVTKQVEFECVVDGDDAVLVGIFFRNVSDTDAVGHVDFQESDNTQVCHFDLTEVDNDADGMQHAYAGAAAAAAIGGEVIAKGLASNSSPTDAATLYVIIGSDST